MTHRDGHEDDDQGNKIEDEHPLVTGCIVSHFLGCNPRQGDERDADQHHHNVLRSPVTQVGVFHGGTAELYMRTYKIKYQPYEQLGVRKGKQQHTGYAIHPAIGFLALPSHVRHGDNQDQQYQYKIAKGGMGKQEMIHDLFGLGA